MYVIFFGGYSTATMGHPITSQWLFVCVHMCMGGSVFACLFVDCWCVCVCVRARVLCVCVCVCGCVCFLWGAYIKHYRNFTHQVRIQCLHRKPFASSVLCYAQTCMQVRLRVKYGLLVVAVADGGVVVIFEVVILNMYLDIVAVLLLWLVLLLLRLLSLLLILLLAALVCCAFLLLVIGY